MQHSAVFYLFSTNNPMFGTQNRPATKDDPMWIIMANN